MSHRVISSSASRTNAQSFPLMVPSVKTRFLCDDVSEMCSSASSQTQDRPKLLMKCSGSVPAFIKRRDSSVQVFGTTPKWKQRVKTSKIEAELQFIHIILNYIRLQSLYCPWGEVWFAAVNSQIYTIRNTWLYQSALLMSDCWAEAVTLALFQRHNATRLWFSIVVWLQTQKQFPTMPW